LHHVKEKTKWTHPRGDINRIEVLRIIRNHSVWEGGIYQHELIKEANLSRQAVYNHLKGLIKERKIMESRGKYVVTQTDDDIFFILLFEAHLDRWLRKMLTLDETFTTQRNKETDFIEKNISDFANILGAFVIYVLLAGKQPIHERALENEKRQYLIRDIIQGRSFLENILYGFNNYFLRMSQKEPYEVMKKKVYDNLVEGFMRVYPNFHADLEGRWRAFAQDFIQKSRQSTPETDKNVKKCKHRTEKHYMFNFGEYLECNICHVRFPMTNSDTKRTP
jgi:hypothetical protein